MGGDYYIYHTKTDFYEYVSLSRRWSIDHLFSQSIFICENQRLKYNVQTARKIRCPIGNYNTIYDVPCKNSYIWFYCGEQFAPVRPYLSISLSINWILVQIVDDDCLSKLHESHSLLVDTPPNSLVMLWRRHSHGLAGPSSDVAWIFFNPAVSNDQRIRMD